MVTSMGERIDRVRGFDAGVDEYITKPHDRTQLLKVVRKLLGHAADGPRSRRMNIVIVSDEPVLAALARRPLEPLGHVVTAVGSVAELEARLHELAPRAALLPRRLPDRSLADTVALLRGARRRRSPRSSSGVAAADRTVARDVDADGFLLVPFSDAEVLDVFGATHAREAADRSLADDSPLIHRHTVPILEDDGYEVHLARTTATRRSRWSASTSPTS